MAKSENIFDDLLAASFDKEIKDIALKILCAFISNPEINNKIKQSNSFKEDLIGQSFSYSYSFFQFAMDIMKQSCEQK